MPTVQHHGLRMNAQAPTPPADHADAALLRAIAEHRDAEAFAEFYRRHEKSIYSLARHLAGRADRAADAVQEAMLRVWTRARNFRDDGNPRGWVLRIVARECLRQNRKRKPSKAEVQHEEILHARQAEANAAPSPLEHDELSAALRSSMEQLPEVCRRAVALYYLAGMSQREIGTCLKVSQKTVSSRLEEALERLRTGLRRAGISSAATSLSATVLTRALETTYTPPPQAGAAALAQWVTSAKVAATAANVSQRAAAYKGAAWLWLGALCLAITAGTAYWRTNQKPQKAEPSKAETSNARGKAPAEETPGVLRHWVFDQGPADDLNLIRGSWTWVPPNGNMPGHMHAPDRAGILLPVPLPKLPLKVWFRYRLIKEGVTHCDCYLTDGKAVPSSTVWEEPVNTTFQRQREYDMAFYFVDNQYLCIYNDSKVLTVRKYDADPPVNQACLLLTNMDVVEIGVRALPESERPAFQKKFDAAVKKWAGKSRKDLGGSL